MMIPNSFAVRAGVLLIGTLILASCGSKPSGNPLNGTWKVSAITCNGQAADSGGTGAGADIAGGNSRKFVFNDSTGGDVRAVSSGCSLTFDTTLAYPGDSKLDVTYTGTTSCSTGCSCTVTSAPTGTVRYSYAFSGMNGFTLTAVTSGVPAYDGLCVAATPAQENPTAYSLKRE